MTGDLETYEGNCYLGIDAGSTTTKAALVGEDGALLYSFYSNNNGSPLKTTIRAIQDIYKKLPDTAKIVRSCSTGYGEALIKAALLLDEGEVETVSHYYAAAFFDPDVDCILDIGGQDMKCIKIKNQTVDSVQLNEACSSGCGSFIETFAKSLNYSVQDFAKAALFAKNPIDLGTRCTVFMNSKVKQASGKKGQKSLISRRLAYSVIKNALYKVIKVSIASSSANTSCAGRYVLQRRRSRVSKDCCDVQSARISPVSWVLCCALIARRRYQDGVETTMLSIDKINHLQFTTTMAKMQRLYQPVPPDHQPFYRGQFVTWKPRERGIGKERNKEKIPNLFEYKNKLLFDRKPLEQSEAVQNVHRHPASSICCKYPFWFEFSRLQKYRGGTFSANPQKI